MARVELAYVVLAALRVLVGLTSERLLSRQLRRLGQMLVAVLRHPDRRDAGFDRTLLMVDLLRWRHVRHHDRLRIQLFRLLKAGILHAIFSVSNARVVLVEQLCEGNRVVFRLWNFD